MSFKKIIDKLENIVSDERDSVYKNALNSLIKIYKKTSIEFEIIDFEVNIDSHYIELCLGKVFFFEININRKSLHIIINKLEEMFFFEDDSFAGLCGNVLNSLFEGDYRIIEYRKHKSKSALFALKFKDNELEFLSKELKELNRDANIISITEGKKMTKTG